MKHIQHEYYHDVVTDLLIIYYKKTHMSLRRIKERLGVGQSRIIRVLNNNKIRGLVTNWNTFDFYSIMVRSDELNTYTERVFRDSLNQYRDMLIRIVNNYLANVEIQNLNLSKCDFCGDYKMRDLTHMIHSSYNCSDRHLPGIIDRLESMFNRID